MRDRGSGGSPTDSDYRTFVNDLHDKLNRFAALYQDKVRIQSRPPDAPLLTEEQFEKEVEAASDISSHVEFMFGARATESLKDALAVHQEIIANLDSVPHSSDATDDMAGPRTETALGYINYALDTWEGQDAIQFHAYLGSVRLALHRQEVLIEALHALADTHNEIVEVARTDILELLNHANEALDNYGSWGSGETSGLLTIVGAGFAIGATLTTGGAAAGLGIAGALATGTESLTEGDDEPYGYGFDGSPEDIRDKLINEIGVLKSHLRGKCQGLSQAVQNLRAIIRDGGKAQIHPGELVPNEPDVYANGDPDRFKLPVYVSVEP